VTSSNIVPSDRADTTSQGKKKGREEKATEKEDVLGGLKARRLFFSQPSLPFVLCPGAGHLPGLIGSTVVEVTANSEKKEKKKGGRKNEGKGFCCNVNVIGFSLTSPSDCHLDRFVFPADRRVRKKKKQKKEEKEKRKKAHGMTDRPDLPAPFRILHRSVSVTARAPGA